MKEQRALDIWQRSKRVGSIFPTFEVERAGGLSRSLEARRTGAAASRSLPGAQWAAEATAAIIRITCPFGCVRTAKYLFLVGNTQDSADGSAPDVEPASDLRFGDASAM